MAEANISSHIYGAEFGIDDDAPRGRGETKCCTDPGLGLVVPYSVMKIEAHRRSAEAGLRSQRVENLGAFCRSGGRTYNIPLTAGKKR